MTRSNGMGMEIGLLAGLLVVNAVFQFVPATELGRLSTSTMDNAMEAVDTFLPYDPTVDKKDEEVAADKEVIDENVENAIQDITPELVISLSPDTEGLGTATTVQNSLPDGNVSSEEIGPPGFMPTEVFPACTRMPPPVYPEMARLAGVEGSVTLWLYIDRDGALQDVQLMNSSDVAALDEAALAAAWNTCWISARNNGMPVGVWTTLTYNFSLAQ